MSWTIILDHLFMVLAASTLAIIIGIPLGILAYMYPKTKAIILNLVDILQTIPALALLGLIMIVAGAGKTTVILGIMLYSLLPIARNTYLGLSEIDPGIKEAAKGVGMTGFERLTKVEFPIAYPTIFTGIRIAIVNAIGIAVFAAFVGGGGIGNMMYQAIRVQDMGGILLSTAVLMVIAVILDLLMSWSEHNIRKSHSNIKKVLASVLIIFIAFGLTVPFEIMQAKSNGKELVMYEGDYSEVRIMHRMAKMLIEKDTKLKVNIKDQMSQVNNYKAMVRGDCDLMLSYDGTLLTTFLHLDPTDVPKDQTLYDFANARGQKRDQTELLGKLGFNNTYAIAVPQKVADQYGLEKVSDLRKVASKLTFGAEHEFFTAEGSMKYGPFVKYYGLKFKNYKPVDASLKYSAVEKGEFDVTEVYATDGLNIKAKLKILEDDKQFFPEYNGCYVVRQDVFERFAADAPNLRQILSQLDGKISTEQMARLTYDVDVKGKSVDEVAEGFLKEQGLL